VKLVDSHCHLDDEQFAKDRDATIERARAAGVERMMAIGTGGGPADLEVAIRLAAQYPFIYATVGVHPHDAAKATPETFACMAELARQPKVLAIGEIGVASPAEQLAVCAQCHRSDGTLEPSDPGFVRFQTPNLIQSRCYTSSGGRLVCITCHAPHRDLSTSTALYESKCLTCHGPASSQSNRVRGESVTAPRCPVNASSGCIGCHMPKVRDRPQHAFFTDHFIRVHSEQQKNGNSEP
jgi:hypothetical protein